MRFESASFNRIVADKSHRVTLTLHDAICLTDSFVFTLGHCVDFKATRFELASFNRIVADKSYRVVSSFIQVIFSGSHYPLPAFIGSNLFFVFFKQVYFSLMYFSFSVKDKCRGLQ